MSTSHLPSGCPADMVEGSYLAEVGQADQVWADLAHRLPPHLLWRLRECVFLLLKPDALQAGKHTILLRGLADAGCRLLHVQATLTASAQHFESLYQYNLTIRNEQNMMGAWWINSPLYEMAPSLAMLIHVPPQRDGLTAHGYIKRLKGPSNPYKGSPGELRWQARGVNLAMNLIHSADDPVSTLREFLIFGTIDQLRTALRHAVLSASGRPEGDDLCGDDRLAEQLFLAGTAERKLGLPDVLIRLKSRLRATEIDADYLLATEDVYAEYRRLAAADLDPVAAWTRFCELCGRERAVLSSFPGSIAPVAYRLAHPHDFRFSTAQEIRAEFLRRNLALGDWDRLALETSLFYHGLLP